MPFTIVQGLPADMRDEEYKDLVSEIRAAVCGVEELGLQEEESEVKVILVPGMTYGGQQRNILVETTGLREEPKRTLQVRKFVAGSVGRVLDAHFPDAYVASRVDDPYDYQNMPFWDNVE